MKAVGITGATGFIGTALVAALLERGDRVRVFTRDPANAHFPSQVEVRQLNFMRELETAEAARAFEALDAVVHLSGESVAGRWNKPKKRAIYDSRVVTTRNLIGALRQLERRPRVLVCASASGYYGDRADEPLLENAGPGTSFLARVCVDWEAGARQAVELGVRVVVLRQGLVLGSDGGALASMLTPFKVGAGGPFGSGRQWWPWIHLQDDVELMLFAIDRDDVSGPVNAVSPDIATNARFAQALGHALHRPSLAPAPGPALKVVLGEFASTLFASALMLPGVAEDAGFSFRHESLDHALLDLLDPGSGREPATTHFEASEKIAARGLEVFEFFSNAANLGALTPAKFDFRLLTPNIEMHRGAIIEYRLKVHGVGVHWKTLVTRWEPVHRFVDYQLRGPYALWRHEHRFEPVGDGVIVRDAIDYALPAAPLSNVALPMVREDVRRIFEYRRTRLNELLLPKAMIG